MKGGASGQKKEGESKQHVKNTTDTHSPVSNDSDSEGDVDERKRRPRHVPGAKGAAPAPQSALAKKLAASAACVPPSPAAVAHAASARPPTAASRPQPSRAQPVGEAKYPRLLVPLMEICKVDTPVIKRIPNAQRSNFAGFWGRLLDQATLSKQESAWAEFFLFPKCILWSPIRGGKRFAKKATFA